MSTVAGVTNLRLKYPGEPSLLFCDLTLSIRPGEKVLLLGPSGCGKSTLLQVLTGLVPQAIEMPMKADEVTVPRSWGYVFQDPDTQFCMPFVDEELAFVLENRSIPRDNMVPLMADVLEKVGLRLEHVHTEIGTLSQGMKQRLAIASALLMEPDVLFLDEPTALLDPDGTQQVWETLKKVGADKTVIIVEHKIAEIADFVDRVVVLNAVGDIIADGDKETVFADLREALRSYGIWYPGVWEEYAAGEGYRELQEKAAHDLARSLSPLLELHRFHGYRGAESRIEFTEAKVYAAEWICVTGENGAGKSTLLLALMQLLRTSGRYRVLDLEPRSVEQLSEHIAFVFQNPEYQFVTNNVRAEVAYSLELKRTAPDIVRRRTDEMLSAFGLASCEERHPYQLSLGQKRRLSVASAIVAGQPIVLLDEPTFGQDARNTFALLERLERLRRAGAALIMVTHDADIVRRFATRVWKVVEGKVVFDGIPEDGRSLTAALSEGATR